MPPAGFLRDTLAGALGADRDCADRTDRRFRNSNAACSRWRDGPKVYKPSIHPLSGVPRSGFWGAVSEIV